MPDHDALDCDQVFDVLTRGPFPTGADSDAAVELHLSQCHACARLAAALRPAIELFEEAVGPDEGRDLPSYWGEVAVELSEPRVACADTVEQRRQRPRRQPLTYYSHLIGELTSSSVWRVAALVALGVLVGSVLRGFSPAEADRPGTDVAEGNVAVELVPGHWTDEPAIVLQSAARPDGQVLLSLVCLGEGGNETLDQPDNHKQWVVRYFSQLDHCCTHCHNATRAAPMPRAAAAAATASVQKTCSFCHFN